MMGKGKFHYAYSMVFSCFILQMVMVVGLQSVPLMLGDIAETLQISATEAGGLTGAFSLFYGSLGFVWGFVSDKIGVRKVLMISIVIMFIFCALFLPTLFTLTGLDFSGILVVLVFAGLTWPVVKVCTIGRDRIRDWWLQRRRTEKAVERPRARS